MNSLLPGLFSLVFIAVGAAILQYALKMAAKVRQSASWPATDGEIAHSAVLYKTGDTTDNSAASFKADIAYRYKVAGANFSSSRISLVDFASTANRARDIVQRYPDKSRVSVYYNPTDPSEGVLEPGNSTGIQWLYAIGSVFTAFGVLFLILSLTHHVHFKG